MLNNKKPVLVKTPLSTQLTEILLNKITNSSMQPGARIDIEKLKEEFGVSQIPIRDALRNLSEQGLVTIVPRIGYFVAELTKDEINDIYEVRMMLELYAIEKGIQTVDVRKLKVLKKEFTSILGNKEFGLEPKDITYFFSLNETLHQGVIIKSSKSKVIENFYSQIINKVRIVSRIVYLPYNDIEEHLGIIDSLLLHDLELAKKLLKEHLELVKTRTLDGYDKIQSRTL